jgi:hypothetical protein
MFNKTTTETLERLEEIKAVYHDKPIFAGNDIYKERMLWILKHI